MSARAAAGIIRRAERRGKVLPKPLADALKAIADGTADQGFSVRRLTPTECELLMGWEKGWTIAKEWKVRGAPKP